jgi:N-acetylglucosaminyldiphosphoundecaprenol N-acetyl-beta-D-mannosaminyltransferase
MPTTWFVGVGISFSFVSGEVQRAPGWMQAAGLEWVHRLVQEPRRLFRRYVVDGLPFAARMFMHALRSRLGRRA